MAEPVSAITIVSTVVKVVTTSVTTVQTISDYVSKYKIAEIQVAAMKSECAAILASLLKLQDIIIQDDILRRPITGEESERLAYVHADYRGILCQCFTVFALLNERLENLNIQQLDKRSKSSAKAKIKAVWYGDSMRILRENVRGQVSAITLLLASFQAGSNIQITNSVVANTQSIANNTQTLEKIFRILTKPENAALLKRVADDSRSLSSLPLARSVIEHDEDAQSIFEGRERPIRSDMSRRSNSAGSPTKPVKETSSTLISDRSSFVTARSKITPSIRSLFGNRKASTQGNGASNSILYGTSTIQRASQTKPRPQLQGQAVVRSGFKRTHPSNVDEVLDEVATSESMNELQDKQKSRWEYLMELSPHQIILDQTIDEYEETDKEFEERAKSLKAQISR